ncbi:uncharacterized protein LOC144088174 isoform X2 [Stigmatopora argus]
MGLIQIYFISAVLFSLFCESNLQGLTCVNDFINNVTCTLNSFPKESGQNCMIFGYKKIWKKRIRDISIQSCKVKQCCNALPGCSFVFEKKFSLFETMPNISMECNNVLVEKLKDYNVASHIKIHPPDRPFVNHTDNDPMIYWGPGSPRSVFLTVFEYKVQIQKRDPMIKEVHTFPTDTPQLNTTALGLEGEHYIRVKVKPADRENSQWSDWSPSVSWVAPSAKPKSSKRAFIVYAALFFSIVTMVIFYKSGIRKRFFQVKPVPNPSKYFKTPQGGNPKTLLSPNCAGVSLHTAQPPDHISPVEVCESCEEVTSRYPSPSANHVPPNYLEASSGSDASGLVDNSSSSSCFSNLGYFVNGSSGSSVQNKSNHVYFAYKNEFHVLHKARDANLCLPFHLCPVLANSPSCESLKRGVQSPDSGICNEKEDEDEEVKEDILGVNREEDQISGHRSSSHLSLPLHLPTQICSPSTPLCLTHIPSDSIKMHASTVTANVSATGWPLACTMDRPSSMPEESEKTGYFILQEIKTTSRNASI